MEERTTDCLCCDSATRGGPLAEPGRTRACLSTTRGCGWAGGTQEGLGPGSQKPHGWNGKEARVNSVGTAVHLRAQL